MAIQSKTKADTLEYLFRKQSACTFKVLPCLKFTVHEWNNCSETICKKIRDINFFQKKLVVRSSAINEDSKITSNAGKYLSIFCNNIKDDFIKAVNKVIDSYDDSNIDNQVLVQPALENVDGFGVAFTIDPNSGGNYYVINYDLSGSTSSITSGEGDSTLLYIYKGERKDLHCNDKTEKNYLEKLRCALEELERIFDSNQLDVEFAFFDNQIFIFQVRPLCVKTDVVKLSTQNNYLQRISSFVLNEMRKKLFLHGEKTVFSNMSDWNPAEIIGVHPKNLALSLYKELITDQVWAYQRDNYGYIRLRSFPLMVDFCGIPYIDVRTSFNSFIPADLPEELANKLVNYYLYKLECNQNKHDKIEFDIIFSCYTFDLPERIKVLLEYGFTEEEIDTILKSLLKLTNRIIDRKKGLWTEDSHKIDILAERYQKIVSSDLDEISKIYWLIADCKRYGTLPFAGLARASFIAVQLLQSLIKEKIITSSEYNLFLMDVNTVSSQMKNDFETLSIGDFLNKYGHLRPGTYEITSPRYDEEPDIYFSLNRSANNNQTLFNKNSSDSCFKLSLEQLDKIKELLLKHGLSNDVLDLFSFIKATIKGREYSKFIFTRNLSEVLRLFASFCSKQNISKDDCAFADINIIKNMYTSSVDIKKEILDSIKNGKQKYYENIHTVLPPVIKTVEDLYCFYINESDPNYVTHKRVIANILNIDSNKKKDLDGYILLISSADPGYDWIFSHKIAGFITKYGGANSHMAIRAMELGIPAVIGVGEKIFDKLSHTTGKISIDCALKQIKYLK